MARKIIKEVAKKTAKKTAKKFKPNPNAPQKQVISGAPEKGTVGAQKTPKAKTKSATPAKRGRPKGSTNKAKGNIQAAKTIASPTARRRNARASKIPTAAQAAIAAPAVGLTALAITSKKKPETEGTFGEAFKAARKKGEGTKFTYKGKQYSAVTKDDLKRKGYDANELRQYMNRKGKARGPLNRLGQGVKKVLLGKDKKFGGDKGAIDFIRGRKKPVKKSGKPGSRKMAKFKAGGAVMANRGLGKAYMKSKR